MLKERRPHFGEHTAHALALHLEDAAHLATGEEREGFYGFFALIGDVSRVNSIPCRFLIGGGLRITESVLKPRKSTLSNPIDSRIGNSYWAMVLVTVTCCRA